MDIAALGLSIDSAPVERAVSALRQLPGAARGASAGVDQLAGSAEREARAVTASTTSLGANARAMQMSGSATRAATAAVNDNAKAMAALGFQTKQTLVQLPDIIQGIASGQGVFRTAIQQGGQLVQIYGMGPGGVGGSLRQVGSELAAMVTPMRLLGGGAVALGVALLAGLNSWKNFALQLDDLAHAAGTTTQEMAKLQAVASFKGIGQQDFASGMEKFAAATYEAQTGTGELAKLLRANGQTVGDTATNIERVADLIKNAGSDQQRLQLLQQAGLPATMEWVRLLSQGADGIKKAKDAAAEFGGAANDQLVAKAREFDEAWNKAWTNFGLQAKNAVVGASNLLDQLSQAGNVLLSKLASGGLAEIGANLLKTGRGNPLSGDVDSLYGGLLRGGARAGSTVDPRQREQALRIEQQYIQTLGELATVQQRVRLEYIAIAQARANGIDISEKEEAALLRLAAANARSADVQAVVGALGSAATITEQYNAKLAQLVVLLDSGKLSFDEFNRAVSGLKLDNQITVLQERVSALGSFATDADKYALAQAQLNQKLQQGKIDQDTYNKALLQANPIFKTLTDSAEQFGTALVEGLAKGEDMAHVLNNALQQVGSTLIRVGVQTAVAGAATGNPAAAGMGLIEIGVGAAISYFASSKQKADQAAQAAAQAAQQLAEAQKQWASMAGKMSSWMAEWTTGFSGELSKAIESARSQMQQFANAANAAHDPAGVAAVQAAFNAGVVRSIQEAINALQNYGTEQSEVAKQIEDVRNKSTDLKNVMIEFGAAAADAAKSVDTQLNAALERLKTKFIDELASKINDLVGAGWVNQLNDLVAEVAQLRQDAAALGIQTSLIDTYYVLAAQKVIDSNELTGASFNAVANALGPLGAGLHEFVAEAEQAAEKLKRSAAEIASAIQNYQDQLFIATQDTNTLAGALAVFDLQARRAREQEIAAGGEALAALEALQAQQRFNIVADFNKRALEEQKRADEERLRQQQRAAEEQQRIWDEAAKFLQGALQNIQNWISSFLAGAQSPLSPSARLASAQSTFSTQYSAALGGDRDALSGITGNAQSLVEAIRAVYGSTTAGQTLIDSMLSQLQSLPSQVSPEQFIVNNLTPPLQDITSAINDMKVDIGAAIATDNPQNIAQALSTYFNAIDSNTDGLLTSTELTSALGADYATGVLHAIDQNGDGIISRAETINQSLGGSATTAGDSISGIDSNTTPLRSNVASSPFDSLIQSIAGVGGTNSFLSSLLGNLGGTNHNPADDLSAMRGLLNTTAGGWLGTLSNQIGNTLTGGTLTGTTERVRYNLESQNKEWRVGWAPAGSIWAPGTGGAAISYLEKGGVIDGPRHASGGVLVNAEGGEYVVNRHDTARFRGALDQMNFGHSLPASNDNTDIIQRLDRLERAIVGATMANAEIVSNNIADLNKTQTELNKRTRVKAAAR